MKPSSLSYLAASRQNVLYAITKSTCLARGDFPAMNSVKNVSSAIGTSHQNYSAQSHGTLFKPTSMSSHLASGLGIKPRLFSPQSGNNLARRELSWRPLPAPLCLFVPEDASTQHIQILVKLVSKSANEPSTELLTSCFMQSEKPILSAEQTAEMQKYKLGLALNFIPRLWGMAENEFYASAVEMATLLKQEAELNNEPICSDHAKMQLLASELEMSLGLPFGSIPVDPDGFVTEKELKLLAVKMANQVNISD